MFCISLVQGSSEQTWCMVQMQQMRTLGTLVSVNAEPLCVLPHPQIWQDIIMCDLAPSLEAILNGSALNFAEFWQNFCKNNCQSFAF